MGVYNVVGKDLLALSVQLGNIVPLKVAKLKG